jgi:hypothetical protein
MKHSVSRIERLFRKVKEGKRRFFNNLPVRKILKLFMRLFTLPTTS